MVRSVQGLGGRGRRRAVVCVLLAAVVLLLAGVAPARAEKFNPYDLRWPVGTPGLPFRTRDLFDRGKIMKVVRILSHTLKTEPHNLEVWDTLSIWLYALWRRSDQKDIKRKVSQLGLRNAAKIIQLAPGKPDGYLIKAIFLGMQAINEGVLNVLYIVAPFRDALDTARKLGPTFLYGAPQWLYGRFLFKLPPPPLSIGNVHTSTTILRRVIKQYPTLAIGRLFLAENLMLQGKKKEALQLLASIKKIHPDTYLTDYLKQTSLIDAANLRSLIDKGWDRFSWDPFLTPLPPLPPRK